MTRLSFVIPAHNEQELIARAIESIKESTLADRLAEIIVADDASTDETASLAQAAGAIVVPLDRRQISAARNAGANAARGDVLVFVDADTFVTQGVVLGCIQAIEDGYTAGGSRVRFDGKIPRYARLLLWFTSLAQKRMKFAAGCFVFAKRDAFHLAGGFDESIYAGEEVEFSKAIKRHGRFTVLDAHVVTSGRKLRAHSAWTILGTLFSLGIRGKRAVRSRDRLWLWYDTNARG